ncbi:MAG: substrate-binding domain-containing protein, partial [Proteiniphilum sp.]|nr:substrate-binding domain-containing protein [Proteiniphilum sp.]
MKITHILTCILPRILPALLFCLLIFSCKQKTESYVIGVSQCSDDEWRHKMNTEMRHEALFYPDVILDIRTVMDDTEKQIHDIQSFIDKKVDLIIVAPNEAAPLTLIVEKAHQAGIPVVLVDRKILSDKYTALISADNYQIGKEVGNYMVKLLGGKGNIVELRGLTGSTPAMERHQGFMSILKDYPGINLLTSVDGAWLKDVAGNKMEEVFATYPEFDAVYAHNDRMAIAAYNVAERLNRAKNIYFIGIDALPGEGGGIEQVLENKLKATFIYPTQGETIIQLALDILQGKPYKKNNTLYTNIVDATNARILKLQTDAIIEQENKISFLNSRIDTYLLQFTTQRYLLWSASCIVLLFIIFFTLLFKAYNSKNRLNIELEKRNNEISEQKNLLEQKRDLLIVLSRQLEEATHAKLVFFTNLSHEFRTPLTLIAGPISSLLANRSIDIEQRRLLTLVQKNIAILLKLIDQIIDFRKYENGKLTLDLSLCDLKQQFIEWNESFWEMAKKRHLHFDFKVFSEADFIMPVDTDKMERIYFNLLSNAFKFTPEKGTISVHLEKITRENTHYAAIQVSNSGKGIPPENIRHIFDRFYQVDSSVTGSGIGLALAKAMVELHQGQISV